MFRVVLASALFFLTACTSTISKDELKKLNGYWEIMEVEFLDGQKKIYRVNPTVDYIEMEDLKGFKKKVYPKFNASYTTSDDIEPFVVVEKNKAFFLQYGTNFNAWQEQLTDLNDESYTVKDEDGIKYTYRKYNAINITE